MPSFQIAKFAWHSAFMTMRAYPRLCVSVLAALLVLMPLADLADGAIAGMPGMGVFATDGLIEQLVWAVAAASLAMATHRLVIVDDRHDHPLWRLPSQYARFALWSLAFPLASAVAHALSLAPTEPHLLILAQCLYMLVITTITVISIRASLLFPAIAVDDEEAGFGLSWRITRGHVWEMVSAGLLSGLPMILAIAVSLFIASEMTSGGLVAASTHGSGTRRVYDLLTSLPSILFIPVFAAVLSRFYQLYRHAPALDAGGGMVTDDPLTA